MVAAPFSVSSDRDHRSWLYNEPMPDYPDQILIEPLPGPFDTTIRPPGSKSLTNRALLLAALAEGTSRLTGVLFSDDTRVMMRALQELGFKLDIDEANTTVTIEGRGGMIPAKRAELHLGNAGTAMRFLTAACCLGEPGSEYTLDGIPRMRERPIGELVDLLRSIQSTGTIEYMGNAGYPPLLIKSFSIEGGGTLIKPTISSQFVSAIMMIAPYAEGGSEIDFDGPITSKPYVEMTLKVMRQFGAVVVVSDDWTEMEFHRGYDGRAYGIEPDASNASYFLAAAGVVSEAKCVIDNLGNKSLQGDARFAEVLEHMGSHVTVDADRVSASHKRLRGIDIDLNAMPDAAMTLATVAVFADGPTTIRNVGNWRVKETDRMAAMKTELEKVGAAVEVHGDDITITPPPGGLIVNPPEGIDTYDDHRMAMAFSILGLRPGGPGITINDPGCVAKTYPGYWDDLEKLRMSAVPAEGGAA